MVTTIVLCCSYMTPPVFISESRDDLLTVLGFREVVVQSGPISVFELPISTVLQTEICRWDEKYQATFNRSCPASSRFSSSDLGAVHRQWGAELARRLQAELGNEYSVEYRT